MRRVLVLLAAVLLVSGCPKKGAAPATAAAGPDVITLFDGLWVGTAKTSPLGPQVYALYFRQEGAALIAETPVLLSDKPLAPGAAQRFTFPDGARGNRLHYRTALGDRGFTEGVLELVDGESGPARRVYTEPGTRARKLTLRFESEGEGKLRFQALLGDDNHMEIVLERAELETVVMDESAQ